MKRIFILFLVLGIFFSGCNQINVSPEEPEQTPFAKVCTDTDSGEEIGTKGKVVSSTGEGEDYCKDGKTLVEHYCSSQKKLMSKEIDCGFDYICSEGACKAATCFDTDSGENSAEFGTVRYGADEYIDTCVNETAVTEYSCDLEGKLSMTNISCVEGETCTQGKCVGATLCTDTDAGDFGSVEGVTRYGSVFYQDKCVGYAVVYEYYCENGTFMQKQVVCPENWYCEEGVCVEGEAHECIDTDEGKYVYTQGTVKYWVDGQKHTETDKCHDDYAVLEVWCTEEGGLGFGIMECNSGDWCSGGRCTGN